MSSAVHITAANQDETDELFARRLQAQEMGLADSTPLMIRSNNQNNNNNNNNPTVINTRISEISSSRATLCAILVVNIPQVIAAIIVLSMHWNDEDVCDAEHTFKWKMWSASSAGRMFLYSFLSTVMHIFKQWLSDHPRFLVRITNIRNIVDALGVVFFVIGNMWLFGDDSAGCQRAGNSPIWKLCLSMLIINYIQISLPCIIAILLIPIFCFCMPCLIRILARLHNPRANMGASDAALQLVPLITIGHEHRNEDNNSCPICLNEMAIGEEARYLTCKHIFHRTCVDEWLRVNASCPTCRQGIQAAPSGDGQAGGV